MILFVEIRYAEQYHELCKNGIKKRLPWESFPSDYVLGLNLLITAPASALSPNAESAALRYPQVHGTG